MLQAAFFRDSLMAENVVQRAVGKTIIWSHNLHLDKEPTARTLGNMLYSKKGDACFTVLTDFSGRANVRIYNDKPTAARWLQKQYEARKETAASMLKKQLKVDKGIVFYNDLVRLQLPVKLSSIDAYGGYEVVGYGQAFDALVIFDNITPTVLYDSSN
jgi:erythromycin esterase-like protein